MAAQQYIGTARIGPSGNASYTGTAGTVGPIGAQVYKVRVVVTTDAWVTTDGSTPSNTSGAYCVALTPEYFTVTPGQSVKAVQVASGGTLYVTQCI
jgi:hypothetical protein